MSDHSLRVLEREAVSDPVAAERLLRHRSVAGVCCNLTGWSAPWERCGCQRDPSIEEADSWLSPELQRIDDIPPQTLLDQQSERWLRIGLSTEPTDWNLAEAGIHLAYEQAGLKPPKKIIKLGSPKAGAERALELRRESNQVGNQVGGQVRNQVWNQVRSQIGNQVRNQVWNQVRSQVRDQVWNQVLNQVLDQVWNQVLNQVLDQVIYGSQDAHWLGFYETFFKMGIRAPLKLRGLSWTAQATGWWWSFEDLVIVTERPSKIEWDGDRVVRIEYPDGWEVAA